MNKNEVTLFDLPERRTIVKVNQAKLIRLVDWARSQTDWITTTGDTIQNYLIIIERDLGFPVAWSTVKEVFKSLGIKYQIVQAARETVRVPLRGQLSSLALRVEALEKRVVELEDVLTKR